MYVVSMFACLFCLFARLFVCIPISLRMYAHMICIFVMHVYVCIFVCICMYMYVYVIRIGLHAGMYSNLLIRYFLNSDDFFFDQSKKQYPLLFEMIDSHCI